MNAAKYDPSERERQTISSRWLGAELLYVAPHAVYQRSIIILLLQRLDLRRGVECMELGREDCLEIFPTLDALPLCCWYQVFLKILAMFANVCTSAGIADMREMELENLLQSVVPHLLVQVRCFSPKPVSRLLQMFGNNHSFAGTPPHHNHAFRLFDVLVELCADQLACPQIGHVSTTCCLPPIPAKSFFFADSVSLSGVCSGSAFLLAGGVLTGGEQQGVFPKPSLASTGV